VRDNHPLSALREETAWANQITWHCACVVNFCFDGNDYQERSQRDKRWQDLSIVVDTWGDIRPNAFDPIWRGDSSKNSAFPEVWFTADMHVIAFGFYHFTCILLLLYKPGPKFAMRNIGRELSPTDKKILEHARAICGSCKCSPATVPALITLCHTIFIWGPLLTLDDERNEVMELLAAFERDHRWPTEWIITSLKGQWGYALNR
jgi:hypothetical protein